MATKPLCSIPNCGKPHKAHGWCENHYYRWRRHGDPLGMAKGKAQRFYREVVLTYEGDECLIWPFATSKGYGRMRRDGRMLTVSRVVCEEVNGPPPTPAHDAAHSCGRGHLACVTKRHLSWKTSAGNKADMLLHGTHNRGDHHYGAKLTDEQVREIRSSDEQGIELATRFHVSQGHISYIRSGVKWGWVK